MCTFNYLHCKNCTVGEPEPGAKTFYREPKPELEPLKKNYSELEPEPLNLILSKPELDPVKVA